MEGFQASAKAMGCLMKDVVALLARHIDVYASTCGRTNINSIGTRILMAKEMANTEKVKGRLLYYFPVDDSQNDAATDGQEENNQGQDSWIGWHNDSGFLTALAGDMYVDDDTGVPISKDEIDPKAGLYVMNRNGSVVRVDIPEDCMAVQIGECLQIVTGGAVVATPHCVRGPDPHWSPLGEQTQQHREMISDTGVSLQKRRVARISFPCFIDTVPSFPLSIPAGCTREEIVQSAVVGCAKVPPLEERWLEDGMDFGSFLQKTFEMYYNWSTK